MTWLIQEKHGLHLPQIGWSLDAQKATARSFVSHAHFDHLGRHREIVCTPATARLMQTRLRGKRIEHTLAFGVTEALTPDSSITLYPAGHVLGSAQCLIAHPEHGTLLYTGDFKLAPSLSSETCATPRADILVMETTFGRSAYRFPSTASLHERIVTFCRNALADGATPVLLAYSLGKAQEVLCIVGRAGLPVMLEHNAHAISEVYRDLGAPLPPYQTFDGKAWDGHVVICPPHQGRHAVVNRLAKTRVAAITGWGIDPGSKYRYRCDEVIPLSDHADFDDLLHFVERVQPKRIFTLHGFDEDFARTLREKGHEAWALGRANQMEFGPGLLN